MRDWCLLVLILVARVCDAVNLTVYDGDSRSTLVVTGESPNSSEAVRILDFFTEYDLVFQNISIMVIPFSTINMSCSLQFYGVVLYGPFFESLVCLTSLDLVDVMITSSNLSSLQKFSSTLTHLYVSNVRTLQSISTQHVLPFNTVGALGTTFSNFDRLSDMTLVNATWDLRSGWDNVSHMLLLLSQNPIVCFPNESMSADRLDMLTYSIYQNTRPVHASTWTRCPFSSHPPGLLAAACSKDFSGTFCQCRHPVHVAVYQDQHEVCGHCSELLQGCLLCQGLSDGNWTGWGFGPSEPMSWDTTNEFFQRQLVALPLGARLSGPVFLEELSCLRCSPGYVLMQPFYYKPHKMCVAVFVDEQLANLELLEKLALLEHVGRTTAKLGEMRATFRIGGYTKHVHDKMREMNLILDKIGILMRVQIVLVEKRPNNAFRHHLVMYYTLTERFNRSQFNQSDLFFDILQNNLTKFGQLKELGDFSFEIELPIAYVGATANYPMVFGILGGACVAFVLLWFLSKHLSPIAENMRLVSVVLGALDIGSDVALISQLMTHAPVFGKGLLSILIVSCFWNTCSTIYIVRQERFRCQSWAKQHFLVAPAVVLLGCVTGAENVLLLCSNIARLAVFDAPVAQKTVDQCHTISLVSNVLEDIPQLILTSLLLTSYNTWNPIAILSVSFMSLKLSLQLVQRVRRMCLVEKPVLS